MLDTYASKYHDLKAPRKLKWKPALGSVTLTIKVGTDSLDLTVTPLHATIIMHFQVTVNCLATCTNLQQQQQLLQSCRAVSDSYM